MAIPVPIFISRDDGVVNSGVGGPEPCSSPYQCRCNTCRPTTTTPPRAKKFGGVLVSGLSQATPCALGHFKRKRGQHWCMPGPRLCFVPLTPQVLVLNKKAEEAQCLVGPIVDASTVINGRTHVVTLCALEGQAAVLRALAKPAAAVALLQPLVADLKRQLGDHELALSAVGLLAKCLLDLFLQHRVESSAVGGMPLSEAGLQTLRELKDAVADWVHMAQAVKPDGHDHVQAKQHADVVALVCSLEEEDMVGGRKD